MSCCMRVIIKRDIQILKHRPICGRAQQAHRRPKVHGSIGIQPIYAILTLTNFI